MRAALQQQLSELVQGLLDESGIAGPVPDFALDVPRSEEHGDFACNAAMLLAKLLRRPPRAIAGQIPERLASVRGVVARVAGPRPPFHTTFTPTPPSLTPHLYV